MKLTAIKYGETTLSRAMIFRGGDPQYKERISLLFYLILVFAPSGTVVYYILVFLDYYAFINAVLAVFNLVPIPPLDGSKILASFLSDRARYTFYQYQNILSTIGIVLLASSALDGPIAMVQNVVYGGVSWLASLPFRLFGIL